MSASRTLTVAVAQPFCVPGDVTGNLDRMDPLLRQAADHGVQLALFSEGGVTGYEANARSIRQAFVPTDAPGRRLLRMARKYRLVIAAGFLERAGDRIYVSHGVFYPDGRVVVQRKARPGPPEQKDPIYQMGPEKREIFEVQGVRCAISICADSGVKDLPNKLARAGVQLHLTPCAGCGSRSWGFAEAELDNPRRMREFLKKSEMVLSFKEAVRQCRLHRMAQAACNQMADDGKTYFHPGHSCLIDSTGELVALIPGVCVFEHLRPRIAWGVIHAQRPRVN